MAMKVNLSLVKKIGLPHYGSLGAGCSVEFELDATMLQTDLDRFHRHVRNAYVACSQAVHDELARQTERRGRAEASTPTPSGNGRSATARPAPTPAGGRALHRATDKQFQYIHQLARQIHGLGLRRLETLASRLTGKPLAQLDALEASSLIDTLKAIKDGHIALDAALNGASP